MDIGPKDTLKFSETESLLWIEVHASITQRVTPSREVEVSSLPSGRWCFIYESWKDQNNYSGTAR